MVWSPDHYLRFGDERTRPAHDLAQRVALDDLRSIVDLGCGPGNSTKVLWAHWPNARVVGVDGSAEMIAAAEAAYPERRWVQADIETWTPDGPVDLVFSNAALHWLGDHSALVSRLFGFVAANGALAFQVPSDAQSPVRRAIHEIAADERWRERARAPSNALTFESPAFYYDVLCGAARSRSARSERSRGVPRQAGGRSEDLLSAATGWPCALPVSPVARDRLRREVRP